MIEVELPDGRILEFPDGTPPETMRAAAGKLVGKPPASPSAAPERSWTDRLGQFGAGVIEGTKTLIGAAPFGVPGVNRLMMENAGRTEESLGQPADETERRLRTAGEYLGPSVPFGPAGMLSSAAGGAAAGQVREMGGGKGVEVIASLLAGGIPAGIANKISKVAQTKAAIRAVPDMDVQQAQASALYDAGRASGQTAPGSLTQGLDAKLNTIATDAGLISPSGAIAPKYESIAHALRMGKDYAKQDMNPEQMQQVRKALQAAAQSADGNEARVGTQMLKEFDNSIRNPLVPEFQEADAIQSRVYRGQEIKEAIDIAARGRPSAPEAALSNEFRALNRKAIRGDLTYPPELEAAVDQAANGGGGRAAASWVGKMAPTNPLSVASAIGSTAGAGVLGGPMGAGAAAGASLVAGPMGKLLANRMAQGDARKALAIALGGPIPEAMTPDQVKAALVAILTSTTAAQTPQ